eukprot:scaffold102714_cov63-Phaeocystis_antarctica.AAC.3
MLAWHARARAHSLLGSCRLAPSPAASSDRPSAGPSAASVLLFLPQKPLPYLPAHPPPARPPSPTVTQPHLRSRVLLLPPERTAAPDVPASLLGTHWRRHSRQHPPAGARQRRRSTWSRRRRRCPRNHWQCWTGHRAETTGVATPMGRGLLPRSSPRLQAAADVAALVIVIKRAATALHIVPQALVRGVRWRSAAARTGGVRWRSAAARCAPPVLACVRWRSAAARTGGVRWRSAAARCAAPVLACVCWTPSAAARCAAPVLSSPASPRSGVASRELLY